MKNNISLSLIICLMALTLSTNGQRYFMKIENPNLNGTSNTAPHEFEFELESFDFGITNNGNLHFGSGAGNGKPELLPFTIKLKQTSNMAQVYKTIHDGGFYRKVIISVVKTFDSPSLQDYLVFTLEEVVTFSAMNIGASSGDDSIFLTATIFSDKLRIKHYLTNSNGSRDNTPLETGWDIIENKSL
ncbi:Type VI protein secretion system component Hcp (secreted cytotoxin) [Spirosomataceae bacterium TFI 002]|nr:Type VI protein secretion system component Hcp (secreted cytotoxin) [Spirosomataceae bacterium TFI 002]